ncbi:hypothetical protein FGO68_gene13291 [Halteria grandinella]|uniref:phenylalanine 4-monooxygenase n=1 Tax=Halteria grandinella TaxID=5974 RepID=A0A8J8NYI9_HALGN|nr:hypothetical protein FGO68_gene13291 [Halteria grandinella]
MLFQRRSISSQVHRCTFPRTLEELQRKVKTCLTNETGLAEEDQECLTDKAYLKRRNLITEISSTYDLVNDKAIPHIEYTQSEAKLWTALYQPLILNTKSHAPSEISSNLETLLKECSLREESIPQLDTISEFHHGWSGWRLRPVGGLLTLQEFLNQLAFKIWPATQYIRHPSGLLYNHEPDFIHEVFGHQAMLMIPECHKVLHKVGLASLGASEGELEQLAAAYWYTFEVGLCLNSKGERKVLGGAVLSSMDETRVAMESERLVGMDIGIITNEKYRQSIQYSGFQPFYVVSPEIGELCSMLDTWLDGFLQRRDFVASYCEESRTIKVADKNFHPSSATMERHQAF